MKIVLVAGARPNFMKIAPILKAIRAHNDGKPGQLIEPLLVHTGQHYDYEMSKVFFEDLELPDPDIYLGVGSGSHAEQTARVMIEFEKVLMENKPGLVMVVGDVNSTLAAALAAAKLHIPVAHVEAGIRSGDMSMPEEINRLLTDHLSDYLFTTSHYDDENLRKEGVSESRIFRVGNVMVDSLMEYKARAEKRPVLAELGLEKHGYVLLTLHRPSNVDERPALEGLLRAAQEIGRSATVIFPAHPRTRKMMKEYNMSAWLESRGTVNVIDPLGYLDFVCLEMNARFIITDSGGVQVEAASLGIPCLTLLDSPVWAVTHDMGTNILVGNDTGVLLKEAGKLMMGQAAEGTGWPLWDGQASGRIIPALLKGTT
jgi:UDP-N-acetylglucosamine 2-epimerase (non-hydrolysing)